MPAAPVTPFTGVWIEIARACRHPGAPVVTPFTGVWIEIDAPTLAIVAGQGHTLHGCVD